NLVTGGEVDAHAQRMEPYRDGEMQVTEALQEHIRYSQAGYEGEEPLDVRLAEAGRWGWRAKWRGVEGEEACGEDLGVLVEDIPGLVAQMLERPSVPEACKQYVRAMMKT